MIAENSGDHVYVLARLERQYGFFKEFREAEEAGRGLGVSFEIKKYPLGLPGQKQVVGGLNPFMAEQAPREETLICGEGRVRSVGSIRYNKEGQATDWWLAPDADRTLTPGEAVRQDYDPFLFPNAFISLPNPFEQGDIVTMATGSKKAEVYGVVLTSQAEWKALYEKGKVGRYADFYDASLIVEFLTDDQGSFVHSHVSPLELERAMPEDEATRFYLQAGQALILGNGSLEGFCMMQRHYQKTIQTPAPEGLPSIAHLGGPMETEP